MHLTPTPAYFLVKIKQLHRALAREVSTFDTGLLDALDLFTTRTSAKPSGTANSLLEKPDSVTTQVSAPKYITDEGIEAIDVEIHYGDPNGSGKTVCPLSIGHMKELLIGTESTQRTQGTGEE
jgi:hypothetical protein